jgi:hypothetical protein
MENKEKYDKALELALEVEAKEEELAKIEYDKAVELDRKVGEI